MPGKKSSPCRVVFLESIALLVFSILLVATTVHCGSDRGLPITARLRIDVSQKGDTIDRRIYGHFIEHMGSCIYGGVWDLETDRLRPDVLAETAALEPPVMRWPGGCFADTYHWEDGIGPLDQRPIVENKAWGSLGEEIGPDDPNHFGTDEFLDFCNALGTTPYINVNLGSGTPEEAAHWLEYVNGPVTSPYGSLRAENGHSSPYGVRLWGIGNEIYGYWETGHSDATAYADRFLEFAAAMKDVDPEIELVAVGCAADDLFCPDGWNRTVVERAGQETDYLSLHQYLPGPIYFVTPSGEDDYYSMVAAPIQIGESLDEFAREIQEAGGGDRIGIALDEWNVCWSYEQILHSDFTLRDALFAAGVINVLQRRSPPVRMANYAQLVNVLGLISTETDRYFLTPVYFVFMLYSSLSQSIHVPVTTESETFSSRELGAIRARENVPYIDASATLSPAEDRLTVFVINRHYSESIRTRIEIAGIDPKNDVAVYELNGPSPEAENDYDSPQVVGIRELEPIAAARELVYTFPPHSLTVLDIPTL